MNERKIELFKQLLDEVNKELISTLDINKVIQLIETKRTIVNRLYELENM